MPEQRLNSWLDVQCSSAGHLFGFQMERLRFVACELPAGGIEILLLIPALYYERGTDIGLIAMAQTNYVITGGLPRYASANRIIIAYFFDDDVLDNNLLLPIPIYFARVEAFRRRHF